MIKKITFILGIILTLVFPSGVYADNSSISLQMTIDKTCPTKTPNCITEGHLLLQNNSSHDLQNWQLGFNSVFPFLPPLNATLSNKEGDYYILSMPAQPNLIAGGQVQVDFKIQAAVTHITDLPQGFFVMATNLPKPMPLTASSQLTQRQLTNAFADNRKYLTEPIEGNPIVFEPAEQTIITPRPANIMVVRNLKFILTPQTSIAADPTAMTAAHFFVDNTYQALGFRLVIRPYTANNSSVGSLIVMTTQGADKNWGSEGYQLYVRPNIIFIRANTDAGFFYAIESLRQLFPPQIFAHAWQRNIVWAAPAVEITDYPRFAYRGLHLDVARHFFTVEEVKRLLDLMALNKLNMFHWHLADDEGWRIEIKQYPQLTQIGAYRGYGLPLQPTLGSGPDPYGGYYTQADVQEIVAYAKARHITIIPEIDTPGHARALVKSMQTPMGNPLEDPQDQSQYTSVQGYHDNVVSPCMPQTYTIMNNIMGELASLFPGPYIHIGGDEVPKGAWEKSPACLVFMANHGIATFPQLQNYYHSKIQEIAASHGKKVGGWEEMLAGGNWVKKDALIYIWNDPSDAKKIANEGYNVIQNPAPYLYFDLAYNDDSAEPGYYWAGYINEHAPYSLTPVTSDMSPAIKNRVLGVQGDLWSENLISQDRLDYMAFPKMAALAELAWTPAKKRQWYNFSDRLGKYYLPILDYYGVNYRLPLPGLHLTTNGIEANNIANGLTMRYTVNGSDPTPSSALYQGIIPSQDLNGIAISSFNADKDQPRSGRVMRVNSEK